MSVLTERPSGMGHRGHLLVWAALAGTLTLYTLSALRLKPEAAFGSYVDDGVYFSLAKALAAGQGYILPSFPGHLPSMKYPELYPLLLAGAWKIHPHFPGNVSIAVGITLSFGCFALLVSFLMLRRWPGLGDWSALGVVLLVGLSGEYLYLSSMVLSDVPFMALLLGAAWLAELSIDATLTPRWCALSAAGAGLLVGLSVGLRSLGIPVAAGIGLLLLFRRQFKKLFWFCLTGLPLTLWWSWPAVSAVLGLHPAVALQDPMRSGWARTVCVYSSYACEWKTTVPNLGALRSIVAQNLRYITQAPATLLLSPLPLGRGFLGFLLAVLVIAAAWAGVWRSWRSGGVRPLHAALPLYILTMAPFQGTFEVNRYLLPFAPLFFAGLWLEGGHIWRIVVAHSKHGCGKDERMAAWVLGMGALALAGTVAFNYVWALPRAMGNLGATRERVYADELGAYGWIRQHADPDARMVADEEGAAYLYTGRQAVRPLTPSAAGLSDVVRHIRASYWLATGADSMVEIRANRAIPPAGQGSLLATAPVVYRSADGFVTLYDTRCLISALPAGSCALGPTNRAAVSH